MSLLDTKIPFTEPTNDIVDCKMPRRAAQPKSVHFSDVAHCCEIPHIDDFSSDLIAAIWIQDEEYSVMAAENAQVALMIINGKRFRNSDDTCDRGLEYRIPDQRDRRRKLKEDARTAVMDEQDRQWNRTLNGPYFIAEVYSEFSTRALCAARFMGQQDEEEARKLEESKSESSPETVRRSVDFLPNLSVKNYLHINDITDEEICCAWYRSSDIREFKLHNKKTVKALICLKVKESDEVVLRGLEYLIPRNWKIKKYNKILTLNAVLDEQDRQDIEGENDPDQIAEAYEEMIPNSSRMAAKKYAREDERFSYVYTARDRTEWELLQHKVSPPSQRPILSPVSSNFAKDSLSKNQGAHLKMIRSVGAKSQNRKNVVATRAAHQDMLHQVLTETLLVLR
jgi:hypothetical protein